MYEETKKCKNCMCKNGGFYSGSLCSLGVGIESIIVFVGYGRAYKVLKLHDI